MLYIVPETIEIMKSIEKLLELALERKPLRLTYESCYSHGNLYTSLKSILPSWDICIPEEHTCAALSDWPAKINRDVVKDWLKKQNIQDTDDLLDGACEPFAFYLSSKIKLMIENGNFDSVEASYQSIKLEFDNLNPRDAAKLVFEKFVQQELQSPLFWGPEIVGSYKDYLFGHENSKNSIQEAANVPHVHIMPLYVLNYIFDGNELSDHDLQSTVEETAQYSLHVVGLVFDKSRNRVVIADPNGSLIPGSNIEFLSMPLKRRKAKASTSTSRFDLDIKKGQRSGGAAEVFIAKSNGELLPGANLTMISGGKRSFSKK